MGGMEGGEAVLQDIMYEGRIKNNNQIHINTLYAYMKSKHIKRVNSQPGGGGTSL